MLQFLLSKNYWIDKNSKNSNGITPTDTLHQSRKDPKHKAVHQILRRANLRQSSSLQFDENWNKHIRWLEDHRSSLMLVASLIAQMAFQAGLNPPGGIDAGYAIAGQDENRKGAFNVYLTCCSVSLFASLNTILILISGLPCRKIMVYVSMVTLWIAILPMPLVYSQSIGIFTPETDVVSIAKLPIDGLFAFDNVTITTAISFVGVLLWVFLLLIIFLGHQISLIIKILRGLRKLIQKACGCCY